MAAVAKAAAALAEAAMAEAAMAADGGDVVVAAAAAGCKWLAGCCLR